MLERYEKVLPLSNVREDYMSGSADIARAYAELGNKQMAMLHVKELWKKYSQYLKWYYNQDSYWFLSSQLEISESLKALVATSGIAADIDPDWGQKMKVSEFIDPIWKQSMATLRADLNSTNFVDNQEEISLHFYILKRLAYIVHDAKDPQVNAKFGEMNMIIQQLQDMGYQVD